VLSEPDPVARAVAERWEVGEATGDHVDGVPVRRLRDGVLVLRRPVRHVHDERLDLRLPGALAALRPTLAFPSIHRSVSGTRCLTVHPLGNPGGSAELGGQPRTLVPTDPRAMAAVFRALRERATGLGIPATYEATHHGPAIALPAFFVEIAHAQEDPPLGEEVAVLSDALRGSPVDPSDQVALAVGGGHYAPHFSDLAWSRKWAFGHILSRHALEDLRAETAREALARSPGAEGIVYARAQDRTHPALAGLGPALRDLDAPRREPGPVGPTSAARPASGT